MAYRRSFLYASTFGGRHVISYLGTTTGGMYYTELRECIALSLFEWALAIFATLFYPEFAAAAAAVVSFNWICLSRSFN